MYNKYGRWEDDERLEGPTGSTNMNVVGLAGQTEKNKSTVTLKEGELTLDSVEVGGTFVIKGKAFEKLGSYLDKGYTIAGVSLYHLLMLPDAVSHQMVHPHRGTIVVKRESDGCICFVDCDVKITGWEPGEKKEDDPHKCISLL